MIVHVLLDLNFVFFYTTGSYSQAGKECSICAITYKEHAYFCRSQREMSSAGNVVCRGKC